MRGRHGFDSALWALTSGGRRAPIARVGFTPQLPARLGTICWVGNGQVLPGCPFSVTSTAADWRRSIVQCTDSVAARGATVWPRASPLEGESPAMHERRPTSSGTAPTIIRDEPFVRGDAMSVSGISSSCLIDSSNQNIHNHLRQFQKEFQQLGADLQTGTLSAARQDFATLRKLAPQGKSPSPTPSSSPIVQMFHQLGRDLQSGDVSAAQQEDSKSTNGPAEPGAARIESQRGRPAPAVRRSSLNCAIHSADRNASLPSCISSSRAFRGRLPMVTIPVRGSLK